MNASLSRELWSYRQLLYFFVWRDVKVRYKQTVLGASWALIQPFFTMIVFTLLFGRLAKLPSDGIPYPIFYYSALLPWTYFATSFANAGNSLISNTNLITKVYFPRMLIPAAAVTGGLVDFGVASLLLFGLMWFHEMPFSLELLVFPLLVLPLALLALGAGLFLSALNVNYRDVKYTIPFLVQMGLFVSPVVYPLSSVPEKYQFLVSLNPMCGIIEAFRAAVVPGKEIAWTAYAVSVFITLLILFIGAKYFRSTERSFADLI